MHIRRAEIKDMGRISHLLLQVAALHAEGRADIFRTATRKYSDTQLQEIITCDETPVFVATDARGQVVGYAFCIYEITQGNRLLQDRKTLYIDDLCVDADARGQGIGTGLWDYVLAFAKEKGFDSITLNVWSFNESARRFYEKCGMTPLKIVMEKDLSHTP